MSYKTILVHLKNERRAAALLRPVFDLSERFGAHVTGITALPPVLVLPTGVPGFGDTVVIDSYRRAYATEAESLRALFADAAIGRPVVTEWRLEDADHLGSRGGVAARILPHARCADLIVAGQDDPSWSGSATHDICERLILDSGRPVLLIPHEFDDPGFGKRILVAWNGARESARAVFDALPLLQRAEQVCVVSIEHTFGQDGKRSNVDHDLAASLVAHGVHCSGIERRHSQSDVGSALLAVVKDHGCDLMVMGCYGHSRFNEFVMGGATWHVLHHMSVPVLMSH